MLINKSSVGETNFSCLAFQLSRPPEESDLHALMHVLAVLNEPLDRIDGGQFLQCFGSHSV